VSFAGLMTLYESNFIRLGWLLPQLPEPGASLVSTATHDMPLHLGVEEVARYTTTLKLTYFFRVGGDFIPDPDLKIRVYHDAGLVEAMACIHKHRHEALVPYSTGSGTELQRRWTRNMMLNKWLEYCADKGHLFAHG